MESFLKLPGMNLLIILFRFLTSSDPGTQSSSLSSLLSLEPSLSSLTDRVLRFLAGGLRVRIGSPAGTAGTGSPVKENKKNNWIGANLLIGNLRFHHESEFSILVCRLCRLYIITSQAKKQNGVIRSLETSLV